MGSTPSHLPAGSTKKNTQASFDMGSTPQQPINIPSDDDSASDSGDSASDSGEPYKPPTPMFELEFIQEVHLFPGSLIEVIGAEPDLLGSFYTGEIIELYWQTYYLVEYDNLFDEERTNERLREIIPAGQLRSQPPIAEGYNDYAVGDEVDVFHEGGYWSGEIVEANRRARKYSVYFPLHGDTKSCRLKQLRPHLEYRTGAEFGWLGIDKYAFLWDV